METQIYELNVGGRSVRYRLREPETKTFFTLPLQSCRDGAYDIFLTREQMDFGRTFFPPNVSEAWLEYKLLLGKTAEVLLRGSASILHAVAMSWRERAWLLCAPSGTGKTTQFVLWKRLLGDEVRLLSGDQPVVTMEPDGTILVWASAWTGKERWIDIPGPVKLGGVIFLAQAPYNELTAPEPGTFAKQMIETFSCRPETEADVRSFAALADGILRHPVWLLRNRGDPASAQMAVDAIDALLKKGD